MENKFVVRNQESEAELWSSRKHKDVKNDANDADGNRKVTRSFTKPFS